MDWEKIKLDSDPRLPYYRQISRKIRSMVFAGELAAGDRLPPSSELTRIFGVSAITVENGVAELVKDGLLCRRRRIGTFVADPPNEPAPAPVHTQDPNYINVVFNTNRPGGHGYLELLCALESACKADGYRVRFSITNPDAPDPVASLVEGCAGIVLMGLPKVELVLELAWSQKPLVLFGDPSDSSPSEMKDIDSVVHDDAERAFLLVKHLVELGHRRILAVVTPAGTPYAANQEKGLRRAAKEFKLSADEFSVHVVTDYLPEFGYKTAYAALCPATRPTACLATDHDLAVGVMQAARDLGLSVPQNLSVVALGSQFNCERSEPKITCFANTSGEMALTLWRKLHAQIRIPRCRKGKTVLAGNALFYGASTMFRKAEERPIARSRSRLREAPASSP